MCILFNSWYSSRSQRTWFCLLFFFFFIIFYLFSDTLCGGRCSANFFNWWWRYFMHKDTDGMMKSGEELGANIKVCICICKRRGWREEERRGRRESHATRGAGSNILRTLRSTVTAWDTLYIARICNTRCFVATLQIYLIQYVYVCVYIYVYIYVEALKDKTMGKTSEWREVRRGSHTFG